MTFLNNILHHLTPLLATRRGRFGIYGVSALVGLLVVRSLMPINARPLSFKSVKSYTVTIPAKGRVRALNEGFLTIKKGGRLDELLAAEGAQVKAGQIIAVVDETSLRAALESAMSSYALAASDLRRVESLRRTASATIQEYDVARSAWLSRRADLETARQKLEDGMVRAPFDGQVTTIAYRKGDFIPDGARIAIVEDRSASRVIVKFPHTMAGRLPASTRLTIARDTAAASANAPQELTATLTTLNAGSDFDLADFDVQLTFNEPLRDISFNDPVKVVVPLETFHSVWSLPSEAIVDQNGQMAIATVTGHKLHLSPIDVLGVTNGTTIIKSRPKHQAVWPLTTALMQKALLRGKSVRVTKS